MKQTKIATQSKPCHDCECWEEMMAITNQELAELRTKRSFDQVSLERERELASRLKTFVQAELQHQREAH
jgi:hypothetical protein